VLLVSDAAEQGRPPELRLRPDEGAAGRLAAAAWARLRHDDGPPLALQSRSLQSLVEIGSGKNTAVEGARSGLVQLAPAPFRPRLPQPPQSTSQSTPAAAGGRHDRLKNLSAQADQAQPATQAPCV
jgi:hypothetical protein